MKREINTKKNEIRTQQIKRKDQRLYYELTRQKHERDLAKDDFALDKETHLVLERPAVASAVSAAGS